MTFHIFFNLLGLPWPFTIEIERKIDNLVAHAIAEAKRSFQPSKLHAIRILRDLSKEPLGLREAKDMIEKEW